MNKERRPTDDLQPGEHDADNLTQKVTLNRRYKVWYIDTSKVDRAQIITASDVFTARTEAMLTIPNISYVISATEIL